MVLGVLGCSGVMFVFIGLRVVWIGNQEIDP